MLVEEKFEDVLQNIEFAIIQVYHDYPEMTNWDTLTAVEALIGAYQDEQKGAPVKTPHLAPLPRQIYESARMICEWRLGRQTPFRDKNGEPLRDLVPVSLAVDDIVACLKRIRKSIKFWDRKGGRQGYLVFVEQFIK